MKKCEIRPNTLLYPVPALMVSSGTADGRLFTLSMRLS